MAHPILVVLLTVSRLSLASALRAQSADTFPVAAATTQRSRDALDHLLSVVPRGGEALATRKSSCA